MSWSQPDISAAVRAAEAASRWVRVLAGGLADDPLDLNLPPINSAVHAPIDAATMELLGGLYFISQLEQTGLLQAAELLIENRFALEIRSIEAGEALELAADESEDWYSATQRQDLYARVFGIGQAATSAATANGAFSGLVLDLCSAIIAWADASRFGSPTAARHRTAVTFAARALRHNLSARQHGNTIAAARRIALQVRTSYDLLSRPGIQAIVTGRSPWDVVRALWAGEPPAIDRLVSAGQSGQQVIGWAGSPAASSGEPGATAVDAAAVWLQSTGFDLEDAA